MAHNQSPLPLELYRLIVQLFHTTHDRRILLSLLLVSRTLRSEAEHSLYRAFSEKSQRSVILFLGTVAACPRLASLVQSYHQALKIHVDQQDVFSALLGTALPAFVKLKRLVFLVRYNKLQGDIFHGCTFQLVELRWICDTPAEGRELTSFLDSQHSLRTLEVALNPLTRNPSSARDLRHLVGSYRTIHAVLPEREILSLHWKRAVPDPYDRQVLPDLNAPLLAAFAKLQTLTFEQPLSDLELKFEKIVQYLPDVTRFHLNGATSTELRRMSEIPLLRHLKLSARNWRPLPEMVAELFSNSRNLSIVDVHGSQPACFWRWRRDCLAPFQMRGRIDSWVG